MCHINTKTPTGQAEHQSAPNASPSKTVIVSSMGRVEIPSLLRKKIQLKPGMKMTATESEGRIVFTPQNGDPLSGLYGKLAGGESLTEALSAERAQVPAKMKPV
jgi:bifunctional DNA-binding transcriptional regulator/antitoxin component of YhaV-PrlF toxin-antitoxin module